METDSKLLIVMERVKGGTLTSLLKERYEKSAQGFTPQEAAVLLKAIFSGVNYIHGQGVVHRDIKPDNILIGDFGDLKSVKIADFGLSARLGLVSNANQLRGGCGTFLFMAPEYFKKTFYTSVN